MTVHDVTTENFDQVVLQATRPVLVDFYASWCPPCRAIAPVLDELAAEFTDRVDIVKVNIDNAPELAQQFDVQGVPTLVAFRSGREIERMVGAASEPTLRSRLSAISESAA